MMVVVQATILEFKRNIEIHYDIAYDINVIHKPENDLVLIVYIFLLT